MPLLRWARAAGRIALLTLPLWVAGCYSPKIKDGTLACTPDLRCPRGFVCRPDHACYRSLADAAIDEPDTDGAAVDTRDALSEPQPGDGGGEPTGGHGGSSATGGSGGAATGGSGGAATGGRGGSAGCGDASCGPKINGSPCAQASDCASQHCIDDVCCNEACTDKCRACDIGPSPGTCMQVTSGPPHGARGACAGSSPCAGSCTSASAIACSFPGDAVMCRAASCVSGTSTMRAGCDSAGGCATAATAPCGDFVCNPAGTACLAACASDNQCAASARPYCQDGACRASRSNGARCDAAAECASQHCVDGYCCNDACQISCQACDVAGRLGTCAPVPTGTPYGGRPPCDGKDACAGYCDGLPSGQCAFPDRSTSCACPIGSGTCDGAGKCQTLVGICI